jgi:two-component system chemotaxis response regulator CheB
VIGIVLSGALDDGTAGLWTIKSRGGIAIVQDPEDAEIPSMPQNALDAVEVDYVMPLNKISELLTNLTSEEVKDFKEPDMDETKKTKLEVGIAKQEPGSEMGSLELGNLSPYACPECHGVLSVIKEGGIIRYRCHTGHGYSADSLLTSITENIEDTLWGAIRGVEESIILLNNLGDHYAEKNQPKLAAMYFKKASEAEARAGMIRQAVLGHEQLTTELIKEQVAQTNGKED